MVYKKIYENRLKLIVNMVENKLKILQLMYKDINNFKRTNKLKEELKTSLSRFIETSSVLKIGKYYTYAPNRGTFSDYAQAYYFKKLKLINIIHFEPKGPCDRDYRKNCNYQVEYKEPYSNRIYSFWTVKECLK